MNDASDVESINPSEAKDGIEEKSHQQTNNNNNEGLQKEIVDHHQQFVDTEVDLENKKEMNNKKHDKSNKNDNEKKNHSKELKKLERKRKREERKQLLEESVPKVDPISGISFTKQQLRRMVKRVRRGLDPIETPQEANERRQREAQLRKLEEAELAGMIVDKTKNNQQGEDEINNYHDDDDDDNVNNVVNQNEEEEHDDDEERGQDVSVISHEDDEKDDPKSFPSPKKGNCDDYVDGGGGGPAIVTNKKARRKKAVPSDYVCQACNNQHQPAHWIYDCPSKVSMRRGNNNNSKKGYRDPDFRKVFVSGLPFDATRQEVIQMFERQQPGTTPPKNPKATTQDQHTTSMQTRHKVLSCKMMTFPDTGRCKGQALLTFETDLGAALAIKEMNGKVIYLDDRKKDSKKKGKEDDNNSSPKTKTQLKLKVTKVLNRAITKKKKEEPTVQSPSKLAKVL